MLVASRLPASWVDIQPEEQKDQICPLRSYFRICFQWAQSRFHSAKENTHTVMSRKYTRAHSKMPASIRRQLTAPWTEMAPEAMGLFFVRSMMHKDLPYWCTEDGRCTKFSYQLMIKNRICQWPWPEWCRQTKHIEYLCGPGHGRKCRWGHRQRSGARYTARRTWSTPVHTQREAAGSGNQSWSVPRL